MQWEQSRRHRVRMWENRPVCGRWSLWTVWSRAGKYLIRRSYKASPKIYAVGTSSANPEAVSAMKAAIASQNEATIRAAAAQWKNAVQQPAADTTTDMTQQPADSAQQGQTQNQTQQTTVPAQTAQ